MTEQAKTYGATGAAIHWISAFLIVVLLGTGFRAGMTVDPEAKAALLRIHLPVAILVLLITAFRLFWWARIGRKPAPLGTSPAWQEALAHWVHRLLYLALLILLASGVAMSALSGLPAILFGGAGPLPDFTELAPRAPHGIAARVLAGLTALHMAAALYHHVILRDGTLRRMWFGGSG